MDAQDCLCRVGRSEVRRSGGQEVAEELGGQRGQEVRGSVGQEVGRTGGQGVRPGQGVRRNRGSTNVICSYPLWFMFYLSSSSSSPSSSSLLHPLLYTPHHNDIYIDISILASYIEHLSTLPLILTIITSRCAEQYLLCRIS